MKKMLQYKWKFPMVVLIAVALTMTIVATANASSDEHLVLQPAELSAQLSPTTHHYSSVDMDEATFFDSTMKMARGPGFNSSVHGYGILSQEPQPIAALANIDEETASLTSGESMARAFCDDNIALAGSEVESALCEYTYMGISSGYSDDLAGGTVCGSDSAYCLSTNVAIESAMMNLSSKRKDAYPRALIAAAGTFKDAYTVNKAIN